MKKKKINFRKIAVTSFIFIASIILLTLIIKKIIYTQTTDYKLLKVGYLKEDVKLINNSLNEEQIKKLLTISFSDKNKDLIADKYFIFDNMERYIAYQTIEPTKTIRDIVATVNVSADRDFYTNIKPVNIDIKEKDLILVNKFYKLDEKYSPDDIVPISLMYAYSDNNISNHIYSNYIKMWKDANKLDLILITASGYRSYELQTKLYNNNVTTKGEKYAEAISARPGHSEHQLGLALDISKYGQGLDETFENTAEFKWLKNNAHNYGFILRYPKDKTHLTGYDYEPWHYRYVGNEVAKYIYENDITFDEYYAYYINK